MHNAFLNIDNKKMSKSLGNFFTVRDISKEYDLQVLRFFMLSAHYRNPINFSHDLMESAKNGLERIVTAVANLKHLSENAKEGSMAADEAEKIASLKEMYDKFEQAMDDDFNTADAISAVFEIVKFANSNSSAENTKEYIDTLIKKITTLTDVLGLKVEKKEEILDKKYIRCIIVGGAKLVLPIYYITLRKRIMKYLKQFLLILCITFVGELVKYVLPLPIPASIYGMVILFVGLMTGHIKLSSVKEVGKFLIEIMPVMFIPAGVGLMVSWNVLKPLLIPVGIITFVSFVAVAVATGKTAQWMIKKDEGKDHE